MMLSRVLIFTLLWLLLTKGQLSSWVIGVLVVPLAAWLSLHLFKPQEHTTSATGAATRLSKPSFDIFRVPQVLAFFIRESILGGWQTATLALRRKRKVTPGFITYKTRLPTGRVRMSFIHLISILPGTLSAKCEGDTLTIHVLDMDSYNSDELIACERQMADLFSLSLDKIRFAQRLP